MRACGYAGGTGGRVVLGGWCVRCMRAGVREGRASGAEYPHLLGGVQCDLQIL